MTQRYRGNYRLDRPSETCKMKQKYDHAMPNLINIYRGIHRQKTAYILFHAMTYAMNLARHEVIDSGLVSPRLVGIGRIFSVKERPAHVRRTKKSNSILRRNCYIPTLAGTSLEVRQSTRG